MTALAIPLAIVPFWNEFQAAHGPDVSSRFYEAMHFDDNEPSANHLAQLVLAGTKRATAGLAWSFEHDGRAAPKPGDLSVVTDWHGKPLCVIATTSISMVPYEDVSAEFAAAEGEGDGSLEYWRKVHWDYFQRECARIGRKPTATMPVLCEHFEVVYPGVE